MATPPPLFRGAWPNGGRVLVGRMHTVLAWVVPPVAPGLLASVAQEQRGRGGAQLPGLSLSLTCSSLIVPAVNSAGTLVWWLPRLGGRRHHVPVSAYAPPRRCAAPCRHPARRACSMALWNGQTSPPVWMPGSGDGALEIGARLARGWNAQRAVARDMRNRPEPCGGERRMVQRGRLVEGPPCGLDGGHVGHATAALAMPLPAPPSGHAGSPQGGPGLPARRAQSSTSPPAPRETRRGRDSYPTGRWWGADPGDTVIGIPSPSW